MWLPRPLLFTTYPPFYIKINGKKIIKGCYATLLLLKSIRRHLQNNFFNYFYHLFFHFNIINYSNIYGIKGHFWHIYVKKKAKKKVQFSKIRSLFCIIVFVFVFNINHLRWCLKLSRAILTPRSSSRTKGLNVFLDFSQGCHSQVCISKSSSLLFHAYPVFASHHIMSYLPGLLGMYCM